MKHCSACGYEYGGIICPRCGGKSLEYPDDSTVRSPLLVEWRKKWLLTWIMAATIMGGVILFIGEIPWEQRLFLAFFIEIFVGAWFLLLNYVQTRALDTSEKGEEFRTGGVPKWRIAIYVLVATALPGYISYPRIKETPHGGLLFCIALLIPAGMVMFFAFMPAMLKKHKPWIAEHKRLIVRLLYIAVALSILLKVWGMLYKK